MKYKITIPETIEINEPALFENASAIIKNQIRHTHVQVNQENVLMFWKVGKY